MRQHTRAYIPAQIHSRDYNLLIERENLDSNTNKMKHVRTMMIDEQIHKKAGGVEPPVFFKDTALFPASYKTVFIPWMIGNIRAIQNTKFHVSFLCRHTVHILFNFLPYKSAETVNYLLNTFDRRMYHILCNIGGIV